jgi:hypothetical protein
MIIYVPTRFILLIHSYMKGVLRPFFMIFEKLMFKLKVLYQKIYLKKSEKYFRFLAPAHQKCRHLVAVRGKAHDALPGGVSGMCHNHVRFRANREILWPLKGLLKVLVEFYEELNFIC